MVCNPEQRVIGVRRGKVAVLYPAAREHRGKERESCSSVPRRKGTSGYGEGKLQCCTPARGNIGVRRGKVAVLYPGAREHRGKERESCNSVPRRKEATGYGKEKWQFCTPPQRSNGV